MAAEIPISSPPPLLLFLPSLAVKKTPLLFKAVLWLQLNFLNPCRLNPPLLSWLKPTFCPFLAGPYHDLDATVPSMVPPRGRVGMRNEGKEKESLPHSKTYQYISFCSDQDCRALWGLVLCTSSTRLSDAQMSGKTLVWGVSARVF